MTFKELHQFLEQKFNQYNTPAFIANDPISIPHLFAKKEDIEIAGFLAATIAWGQRKSIINNAYKLMQYMDFNPYQFLIHHQPSDLKPFASFCHRTFNGKDALYFIKSLSLIYKDYSSIEDIFISSLNKNPDIKTAIHYFRNIFFKLPCSHPLTYRHFSDPQKNSALKRLNMFLRWMVRKDNCGVDFGIWKKVSPALLYCPLDVHSAAVARKLKLLTRKQNDWTAVDELTANLRLHDPSDPAKYDFALFASDFD
ncbi:MAG: TIGR02757 family protein [Bacteroidales bacterium]|nr:TIGR02757 family protein [Bacteroidales bacterium]